MRRMLPKLQNKNFVTQAKDLKCLYNCHNLGCVYQESMAGSVIQATGTMVFEDGLLIGNHLDARNGLQRVCTIPGVQPGAVRTPGFLRGMTEFQSA